MIIKEDFIKPYVINVYYDGFQIQEEKSTGGYQNVGDVIPISYEKHLPTILAQLILANRKEVVTLTQYREMINELKNRIEAYFIHGYSTELQNKEENIKTREIL